MVKIVFVNRCYWPDSEATGQLLQDLAEHLAAEGNDVHVICGQPNSPNPGAEFVVSGTQMVGGVTIHRLKHSQFKKRIPAGRILNLLSFTWATKRYLKVNGDALGGDLFVAETDPFLLPIVIADHSKRMKAQFVAYLQDIYPDVAEAIGKAKDGPVNRSIRRRLRRAYEMADHVVVLGSCMLDRLTQDPWSLDAAKISIIPNWADCQSIRPIDETSNPMRRDWDTNDFIVMHSGNMGLTQRLDVLVDATNDPSWPENARLLLIGDGAARASLESHAQNLGGSNGDPDGSFASRQRDQESSVSFLPYAPREQLAQSLSAADLHVVSMHENITGCLCPSKLYGILAAGRPVLAIAPEDTDLCRTVREHDVGWTCTPGNSSQIAQAVARAASALRQQRQIIQHRCRELAQSQYDRPVALARFSGLVDRLTTADSSTEK